MVRGWSCSCPRQGCTVLTILVLTGAYNLVQLVCIGSTELEVTGSVQSVGNKSYPSIIHPPYLDAKLVILYNNITMVINVAVILSCLSALLAISKGLAFLLLPWILSFFISVIYESSIFFYLITNSKTSFDPVSAFILAIDFVLILVMVLCLIRIFHLYQKLRQGIDHDQRDNRAGNQEVLVEESSEIASARVSSIYRKSFYKKTLRNQNLKLNKKLTSLSKISEEESENIYKSDNHQSDNIIDKVVDKDMFSDKAITNSTSDNQSQAENNNHDKGRSSIVSRFVPELLSRNKFPVDASLHD